MSCVCVCVCVCVCISEVGGWMKVYMCVCVDIYIKIYLCFCPDFCYPVLTDALRGLGELLCVCVCVCV